MSQIWKKNPLSQSNQIKKINIKRFYLFEQII